MTKKTLVAITGGLVLLAGIALIVLPGPAFLVIPAGLAILATEFVWAAKLKQRCSDKVNQCRETYRRKKAGKRACA